MEFPRSRPLVDQRRGMLLSGGYPLGSGTLLDATDGMLPTINTMMVLGLVSLPGMMTGQILAGANPIDAVRYKL